jgi:hypothetical protein
VHVGLDGYLIDRRRSDPPGGEVAHRRRENCAGSTIRQPLPQVLPFSSEWHSAARQLFLLCEPPQRGPYIGLVVGKCIHAKDRMMQPIDWEARRRPARLNNLHWLVQRLADLSQRAEPLRSRCCWNIDGTLDCFRHFGKRRLEQEHFIHLSSRPWRWLGGAWVW